MNLELSKPQNIFLNRLDTKFRAYVAGMGSGKTFIGCIDLLLFALKHKGVVQGYFGPTYPSIRDIFYPSLEEAAEKMGLSVSFNYSNKEVSIYVGSTYYGTIICRSMEKPGSIIGFKIARALCDELDTLPFAKAKLAWIKILARLRYQVDNVVNGVGVTTTPEGYNFVYELFAKDPSESYSMVQASTYANIKNLPPDYIESLLETYPEQIAKAYINGEFVNLTSGSVYSNYDRALNDTKREYKKGEPIFVGMDFNVGKMSAIVHVKDNGMPRAIDEVVNAFDTPQMIRILQERYPDASSIRVYPDASGGSRKSVDASISDIRLLEAARFKVIANKKNPFVKDRVMAMQMQFLSNDGQRHYLVNADKCPTYADNLEQQVWSESGEPDKSAGKDHTNDAAGYFICYDYPIVRPAANMNIRFAH